ncbi:hypothetical protein Mal15_29180 [Stieleria maiorica]|uniref:Uncharacterized protein n=1 Tax=Stieleria maiorica TaxID=2795974 RepID=A0A5B9MC18_9BACT|nr:hypothetical protein [Stieleria maiorica]QEF98861.1 hypothetical protein Mal15_29180 [Stieleria maiorica]
MFRRVSVAGILTLAALCFANSAAAGMSSENVVVVVNGDSTVSRTIANHYIDARKIPTKNVVVLSDVPGGLEIDLESFRERILKPLLAEIDARGISTRVRVIAYSADFPTAVKIPSHCEKLTDPTAKRYQLPVASITGLTYFYRYVLADDPGYLSFAANLYARGKFERHFLNPFAGDKKAEFEQATALLKDEKYAEAAVIWRKLHEEHPETMPALALRAAEAYSLDGQAESAVEMIRAALKAGWRSSSYLTETPALEKHLSDPQIQTSLPYLDDSPIAWQGPQAFASNVGWTLTGSPVAIKDGGIPYLCSCSLAVVHPGGSTLSDAVRVLLRASKGDRTFPRARFAFSTTADVRSKTRYPGIADTVVYLQENGFETEVFNSVVPSKEGAVAGLMLGTSTADVMAKPWILVRGSIAENLTSFGAAFGNRSQTKLTAFLSAGAAMSSGTVTEPYSLQFKFPTPMLYGYYAQGLSAIESFYQSVASPYQLLIVGDPLAQPFAKAPDELVQSAFVSEGKRRLRIERRSMRLKVPKSRAASMELSIDDRIFQVVPLTGTVDVKTVEINWPDNTSGIYDVRATLIGLDRTEPRVTFVSEVDVDGNHPAPTATITKPRSDADGFGNDGSNATAIQVDLECPGADRIELHHLGISVATVDSDQGTATIPTKTLGGGPLRFRPIAFFGDKKVRGKILVDQLQPLK